MNPSGLCQCGCGKATTIARRNDSVNHQVKGQPMRYCTGHANGKTWLERFWEKVNKTESCWLWTGCIEDGYGRLNQFGKHRGAHQISWAIHNGPIPHRMQVLHTCDVRACVNPAHLYLGTNRDNMRDKFTKGRQAKGTAHGMAKLTEAQVDCVVALREAGMTQKAIGILFSVHHKTIANVEHGRSWRITRGGGHSAVRPLPRPPD